MNNIRELLAKKGSSVWSVGPDDAVFEAVRAMAEHEAGALAVLDTGALVGIISERDYARKIALKGRSSKDTLIREIMTLRVIYATPAQRIEDCMAIMNQNNIRHMPVLENGSVVGMLSLKDLVNVIIERQQSIIEELETFVLG
jgi:CBS domain-containing protein